MKRRNTKWNRILEDDIIPLIRTYHMRGLSPTLRELHYSLTSSGKGYPNTKSFYQSLSEIVVKARKEGRIRWDALRDNTRHHLGDYHFTSREDYIDRGINYLKSAPKDYLDTMYVWHKQPHYIEVWIEKDAMAGVFQQILRGQHITIVVNRGYASWTFLYENCMRLRKLRKNNPDLEIHILYFGDLDPSGRDMENQILEAFRGFRLQGIEGQKDIHFDRIAVTVEQIERFNLPQQPEDNETIKKIENDPRTRRSIDENGGELYAVELDALYALYPVEFKVLVLEPIEDLFEKIYTMM
jgi:hypothetical protein